MPTRGSGRNFARLSESAELPVVGVVLMTPLVKPYCEARSWASFQPFVDSKRMPPRISNVGLSLQVSSRYTAPIKLCQFRGVGWGTTVKVLTVPCRKVVSEAKEA